MLLARKDGKVYSSRRALAADFPHVMFGANIGEETLKKLGLQHVSDNPPVLKPWQTFSEAPKVVKKRSQFVMEYSVVDKPADELKAIKLEQLKHRREEAEAAGINIDGAIFDSDERSLSRIQSLLQFMGTNGQRNMSWKAKNAWLQMTPAKLEAAAKKIVEHQQSCFENERRHAEAIADLQDAEKIFNYDTGVGW